MGLHTKILEVGKDTVKERPTFISSDEPRKDMESVTRDKSRDGYVVFVECAPPAIKEGYDLAGFHGLGKCFRKEEVFGHGCLRDSLRI